MTTAFSHTVRGQWFSAFQAQPAGLAFALATVVSGGAALVTLCTGKVFVPNVYRLRAGWLAFAVVLLILSGWAYKIISGLVTGTLPYH